MTKGLVDQSGAMYLKSRDLKSAGVFKTGQSKCPVSRWHFNLSFSARPIMSWTQLEMSSQYLQWITKQLSITGISWSHFWMLRSVIGSTCTDGAPLTMEEKQHNRNMIAYSFFYGTGIQGEEERKRFCFSRKKNLKYNFQKKKKEKQLTILLPLDFLGLYKQEQQEGKSQAESRLPRQQDVTLSATWRWESRSPEVTTVPK